MIEKYLPSNGTEGEIFFDGWCRQCARDRSMRDGEPFDDCDDNELCDIIARSFRGEVDEWVYGPDDEPMCTAFEAAREAARLPDVRFHDLRHTYASWLAQDGASMAMIRDLLGHASMQTTSRYAHLGRRDLIEATRRVGDRLGSETKRRKSA